MAVEEKQQIERAIETARDGVSNRIDELDRKLRTTLDFQSIAAQNAPQLMAGGAAIGFLVGFGFPKLLRRMIAIGVPLALVAMKVQKSRAGANGSSRFADF